MSSSLCEHEKAANEVRWPLPQAISSGEAAGLPSPLSPPPCISLDSRSCGKKFVFFYDDSFLSLTKKSGFEILISRKMREIRIDEKYHSTIIYSLEIGLPILILLISGLLLTPRK